MPTPEKQYYSETLEKGLNILRLFNEYNQGLTLTEISRSLGINKTSIYRYLNTYCKLGYLRKDPHTKLFKLGPRTISLAQSFLQGSDLVNLIKPVVDKVHIQQKIHIDVGLLHRDSIYLIYRMGTKDTLTFQHFTVGRELHLLALGKAVMAFLPKNEQQDLVDGLDFKKKTSNSIMSKSDLIVELKTTFKKGYATGDEEFIPGLISIAAPIVDLHKSQVHGAISFDSSTSRHTMKKFEQKYSDTLVSTAKEISALLPDS
ncbi:MAG: IclR family transcriptional regulator [Proteobacteria bacterium]|nr:IclR family transcriptional regulator [Pseudomonadota bacterium]